MKLGAAWFGFREQTPTNYFEIAAALGLRYIEVPIYEGIIGGYRFQQLVSDKDLKTILAIADNAGVTLVSSVSQMELGGGFDIRGNDISKSVVEFNRAAAKRVIDVGAELGLEVMRITEPNIEPNRMEAEQSYLEEYAEALRPLGDYAEQRGLRIVIENYGITSTQVKQLLDSVDHPWVGTLYDPCNYHRIGEDPLQALKSLKDRVFYCHLKDAFRDDPRDPNLLYKGSRWTPSVAVGEGEIDWGPIILELSTFYTGYLCVEYEISETCVYGTRVSKENLVRIAREQGIGFSN